MNLNTSFSNLIDASATDTHDTFGGAIASVEGKTGSEIEPKSVQARPRRIAEKISDNSVKI